MADTITGETYYLMSLRGERVGTLIRHDGVWCAFPMIDQDERGFPYGMGSTRRQAIEDWVRRGGLEWPR